MRKRIKFFTFLLVLPLLLCNKVINVKAQEDLLQNAKSAILIAENGKVLYEKNCDEKQPIASIVKLMTLKLTFDSLDKGKLKLDDEVYVSENASSMGGSQMFLDANSKHKLSDIIKGVIVASANDGAVVLAETVAGSESSFVKMMNEEAIKLGLGNSNFTDCTGLSGDHYSTARDVATLASNVLTNSLYQTYSKIWLENYTHPTGRVTELSNTNRLIRFFSGCDAGKTGSTDEAGYCLAATAKRDNMRLISVVLGAKTSADRFSDSKDILNYGFNHFENKILFTVDDVCHTTSFRRYHDLVDLYPQKNLEVVLPKGKEINYQTQVELFTNSAPFKNGDVVGEIKVVSDGNIISKVNLISKQDIDKSSLFEIADNLIKNWKI